MKWDFKGFFEKTKRYFREVRSELRKVQFPERRELVTYTLVVGASVLFISSLIWVIDSVLSQALGLVIR